MCDQLDWLGYLLSFRYDLSVSLGGFACYEYGLQCGNWWVVGVGSTFNRQSLAGGS